jgi:hypothetical protein
VRSVKRNAVVLTFRGWARLVSVPVVVPGKQGTKRHVIVHSLDHSLEF